MDQPKQAAPRRRTVRLEVTMRTDGTVSVANQCHTDAAACAGLAQRVAAALGPRADAALVADEPRRAPEHTNEHEHEA